MPTNSIESIKGLEIINKDHLDKLSILEPVLQKWIKTVEYYSDIYEDDACYWYNERANVGILAAATWMTKGWHALEEYSTKKHGETCDDDKRYGRCDLYIAKRDGVSFAIEAKHAWQDIGDRCQDRLRASEAKFKAAVEDARKLQNKEDADHRLAACFILPRLPEKQNNNIDSKIKEWLKDTVKMKNVDAIAWCFPKTSRELLSGQHNYIYPGVCLAINVVLRS